MLGHSVNVTSTAAGLPVYRGPFGRREAERLLWRAGFGPRRGEAEGLARLGLDAAVQQLTRPAARDRFVGPPPRDSKGRPLAPLDAWGHDHAWWLDRMVRTSRPLVERMALVWHDWFATSNAGIGSQKLMIRQNELFRRLGLGSFETLLLEVTKDPAMLIWLSGAENEERAPNENYARELMELFTLGASRGYTERDVREQARALTGWRNDWRNGAGFVNFRYDAARHDVGVKQVFDRRGRFDWKDACHLCLEHPLHPSFFVRKVWSYFVPVSPARSTERGLERLYRASGMQVRPIVEAILRHPALYEGPRMVKAPVVHTAGMLRILGRGVRQADEWAWRNWLAGQQLFYPPNVAGWDDDHWLDTATFRGRWVGIAGILQSYALKPERPPKNQPSTPDRLLASALAFWGNPTLSAETSRALLRFARRSLADAREGWQKRQYPVLVENGLRLLIVVSPDYLTS
jgi:uncharacterized protein (DUF1800 family)